MNRFNTASESPAASAITRRRALQLGGAALALGGAGVLTSGNAAAARELAGSTVYASSFGYDPDDATDALQSALDSSATTVVIDDVGSEWLTRPLAIRRDNLRVVFERGVTVRAKPGAYADRGARVFTINDRNEVSLIGYGATIAMNEAEYAEADPEGQWRHAINVQSTRNLLIEGLAITGAGGDAIYLGDLSGGNLPYSENVVIRNTRCYDNYRNGLSVISAKNLLVEGCAFTDMQGHTPRAGIDFEPNHPDEQLTDIVVRDCVLDNNTGGGLKWVLRRLGGSATPISILMERIYVGYSSSPTPSAIYYGPTGGADPGGVIEVRDSLIDTAPYSGSMAVVTKQPDGARLKFTRTVALNWGNETGHYPPIYFTGLSAGNDFGGVTWDGCLLVTDQETPAVVTHQSSPPATVADIGGDITIVDPHGVTVDFGPDTRDVTLQVRALEAIPTSTVTVRALRATVHRGAPITLLFTRESADLAAPLAVRFAMSGDATERIDTDGSAGMIVIPPGRTTARAVVGTRRGTANPPGARSAMFSILPTVAYSAGDPASASVTIAD